MRIGIDISQIVYEGTGVGRYVRELVKAILERDKKNTYVLFASSLRKRDVFYAYCNSLSFDTKRVALAVFPFPPTLLDFMWNILRLFPIEWFIGDVDIFWSSDWTQPPLAKARGITTIHDLAVFHFPRSFNKKILTVQRRRLARAKKECTTFLCDSEATKRDVIDLMHIDGSKIHVVYPGFH